MNDLSHSFEVAVVFEWITANDLLRALAAAHNVPAILIITGAKEMARTNFWTAGISATDWTMFRRAHGSRKYRWAGDCSRCIQDPDAAMRIRIIQ